MKKNDDLKYDGSYNSSERVHAIIMSIQEEWAGLAEGTSGNIPFNALRALEFEIRGFVCSQKNHTQEDILLYKIDDFWHDFYLLNKINSRNQDEYKSRFKTNFREQTTIMSQIFSLLIRIGYISTLLMGKRERMNMGDAD